MELIFEPNLTEDFEFRIPGKRWKMAKCKTQMQHFGWFSKTIKWFCFQLPKSSEFFCPAESYYSHTERGYL